MTAYNLYNVDLSYWNLSLAGMKLEANDGIHQLELSINSTNTTFEGYDKFAKDIALMHEIQKRCQTDPAVKEAYEKLLTVMALSR